MAKLTYFPLLIDRWIAGTQELTFEERGFYISLIVWLYDTGKPIKDSDHAARILRCDKRTSRRLLGKLRPKFRLTSAGLRHRLCDELLKNGGKIKMLDGNRLPLKPEPDPEVTDLPYLPSQDSGSESKEDQLSTSASANEDQCPHKRIIELYHELTPCRRVRTWNGQRPGLLRQLWRQHPDLDWWRGYFEYIAESDWLCGRCTPTNGRPVFMADLEWLIRPANFQKINEGKYHRGLRPTGH